MFSLDEILIKRLRRQTGFPIQVGASKGNFFTGRFRLEDFVISNPEGYPLEEFFSVEEVSAHVSPSSLMSGRLQVRKLRVHVRRLTGVRAASGEINIEEFRQALENGGPSENGHGSSSREIHIEHLAVKVDHIATVDYADTAHGRRDYPLSFNREFTDVKDLISLGPPLVDHCDAAGLMRASNVIFAALLPDFLWEKIGGMQ